MIIYLCYLRPLLPSLHQQFQPFMDSIWRLKLMLVISQSHLNRYRLMEENLAGDTVH